jgi:hypothetical protein
VTEVLNPERAVEWPFVSRLETGESKTSGCGRIKGRLIRAQRVCNSEYCKSTDNHWWVLVAEGG